MDATSKKKPYVCPPLIQIIAMTWFGKSKALKRSKGKKNNSGYDWAPNVFPNATHVKKALEAGAPVPKQIPVPMMAFAATSVRLAPDMSHQATHELNTHLQLEFALKEWDQGFNRPLPLEDDNLKDIYEFHVKKLNDMSANTRSLMLQFVYREARCVLYISTSTPYVNCHRDWAPPHVVIEISSDSDAPSVHTDEAEALYT